MKKNILCRLLSLLLLGALTFLLCACPGGGPIEPPAPCTHEYADGKCTLCGADDPNAGTGGVTPPPGGEDMIFGEGNEIEGAGDTLAASGAVFTPASYDESKASNAAAGNFVRGALKKMSPVAVYRAEGGEAKVMGANAQNVTYDGQGGAILVPDGILFSDASKLTVKNMTIVGNITVEGKEVIFEACKIIGTVTVKKSSSNVVFNDCRVEGDFTVAGNEVTILNSYISFAGNGVSATGNGLTVQNCRLEGTGTAVTISGEDCAVKYSTLTLSEQDTGISFAKGTVNGFAMMNRITGAQRSVVASEAFNTVAVRNTMISAYGTACTNLYICDNQMGGRAVLKDNNYLLCDGNVYPTDDLNHVAIQENNQNTNGDTLMDVDARLEAGADANLLPHVNREQFVGMERKKTVKDVLVDYSSEISQYVDLHSRSNTEVYIAPGAYTTDRSISFKANNKNTTLYAYGVYMERAFSAGLSELLACDATENVTVKGLAVGYEQQACQQVYVLEKLSGNRLRVVTGAGMMNVFGNTDPQYQYQSNIMYLMPSSWNYTAIGDVNWIDAKKESDGTIILSTDVTSYDLAEPGDVFTTRFPTVYRAVGTVNSKDVKYMDVTVYGSTAGLCCWESRNNGTVYYRMADTTQAGLIIDKATYERYEALENQYGVDLQISIDEKGRFRGSPAHLGSIDGIQSSQCDKGSQVISCLFEKMCDDGSLQKGSHARLYKIEDNGDGTVTIVYKGNAAIVNYKSAKDAKFGACAPFRVGDRIYVYTSAGELVCDGLTLSATQDNGESKPATFNADMQVPIYRVTVSKSALVENYEEILSRSDLHGDQPDTEGKVLVDNMSRSCNGFLFDNVLVQDIRTRGLLIKASDGVITNCTFRNCAKLGVAVIYEIYYGESGNSQNITIDNNLIDNVGYALGGNGLYVHYPINISGLTGGSTENGKILYYNVSITGNVFRSIHNDYYVYLQGVRDVTVKGNTFEGYADGDTDGHFVRALLLNGAVNVELSDNVYTDYVM